MSSQDFHQQYSLAEIDYDFNSQGIQDNTLDITGDIGSIYNRGGTNQRPSIYQHLNNRDSGSGSSYRPDNWNDRNFTTRPTLDPSDRRETITTPNSHLQNSGRGSISLNGGGFKSQQTLQEVRQQDSINTRREDQNNKLKNQALVFILAAAKFFVINMLKAFNSEIYDESSPQSFNDFLQSRYLLSNMTNILSLLLVGNLIDNCSDHRYLVTICNVFLSTAYTIYGILILVYAKKHQLFDNAAEQILSSNMSLLIDLLEPSIFIIIWLQLFNWFSKKQIAVVYGLLQCVQVLANITMVLIQQDLSNYKYLIGGGLMFVFSLIDWKYFKFYPIEAGIFIDVEGRNRNDLTFFHQLRDYLQSQGTTPVTAYEAFYKQKIGKSQRITFIEVLQYTEIRLLIAAGALRQTCLLLSVGFDMKHFLTLDRVNYKNYQIVFFSGAGCAYVFSTILFQYAFKRKLAFTILFCQFISLSLTFFYIVKDLMLPELLFFQPEVSQYTVLFILGLGDGSTILLIYQIGPLIAASNHRKTYEITQGGTMITIVIALSFLLGSGLGILCESVGEWSGNEQTQKIILCIVYVLASLPFLIPAIDDLHQLMVDDKYRAESIQDFNGRINSSINGPLDHNSR